MPAATATALGGRVRSRAPRRTCWRLAVLLGLSWAALLLLGATAHAACEGPRCEHPSGSSERQDEPRSEPQSEPEVPLVGRLLGTVEEPLAKPLRGVVGLATTTLEGVAGTTAAAPIPAESPAETIDDTPALPVADAAGPAPTAGATPVDTVTNTVRGTLAATGDRLRRGQVASIRSTTTPLVHGLTRQVVGVADAAVDAVEALTAPLPLAGELTRTLRGTVATVDLTTRLVVGTTDGVTGIVDGVVDGAGTVLAPVVAKVVLPVVDTVVDDVVGGVVGGVVDPAGNGSGDETAPDPGTVPVPATAVPGHGLAIAVPMLGIDAPQAAPAPGARLLSGPEVPPPSALHVSPAVQPAADTVTAVPVPVSGAGSISGSGGAASAPRPDQPLAQVASASADALLTGEPVGSPTGPMPGTPAADPSFSPD